MAKSKRTVARAQQEYELLCQAHPDAHCELDHSNPFELLVATVLSAQTTDKLVNRVTPALFEKFPDAAALAKAEVEEVSGLLRHLGMFRQKAKNLVSLARLLVERHEGEVPREFPALLELPGVGRKTANVVLGVAFHAAVGVVVDTHVQRITQRLGWTKHSEPGPIERDLMALFPQSEWDRLSHVLIFHGRRVCDAQRPACNECTLAKSCPSAGRAERVGRKPHRTRPRGI